MKTIKVIDEFITIDTKQMPVRVTKHYHDLFVPAHSHSFYEFVYIESGFCSHRINDTIHILYPGCFFGMKPYDQHAYFHVRDTCIYNCLFYPEALDKHFLKLSAFPGLESVFSENEGSGCLNMYISPVFQTEIADLFIKMAKECEEKKNGFELMLKSQLFELLILISRAYEIKHIDIRNNQYFNMSNISDIAEYISVNYSQALSVEELANMACMNVDYFSRSFKKVTGMTPLDYINTVRISKAFEMLKQANIPISQISAEVGIEDPNYFTRLFKKITGKTPSELRKTIIKPGKDLKIHH